jgi:hypothetical protein
MMRTTKLFVALAFLGVGACHVGRSGADLPVARQPDGARVTLRTASGAYAGELLAVQDDGVVISSDRIMFAPFAAIIALEMEGMGRQFRLRQSAVPTGEQLARFRAVSRFPQGLTPNIRAVLLAQRSQAEIAVIQ